MNHNLTDVLVDNEYLHKELDVLTDRNQRQASIIRWLLDELRHLGKDIDILSLLPATEAGAPPADTCCGNWHGTPGDQPHQDTILALANAEEDRECLAEDVRRCMAEIRRLHAERAMDAAESFFRSLSVADEGGAQ